MKPSSEQLEYVSLMLWEGLVLILIERDIVGKEDAATLVNSIIETVQDETNDLSNTKDDTELMRVLRAIAGSVSAAS